MIDNDDFDVIIAGMRTTVDLKNLGALDELVSELHAKGRSELLDEMILARRDQEARRALIKLAGKCPNLGRIVRDEDGERVKVWDTK